MKVARLEHALWSVEMPSERRDNCVGALTLLKIGVMTVDDFWHHLTIQLDTKTLEQVVALLRKVA